MTPAEVAEETQRPGPVLRLHRVGHVGLGHAGRAAARALHDARHEQEPDRVGHAEHGERHGRCAQPDQQRGPPPIAIRHSAPERSREELGDGERGDQSPDRFGRGVQPERVERQQRQDDHEADRVHEADEDQHGQPPEPGAMAVGRRRHPALPRSAPTANTAALTSMSTTP
jgi:hypothetical protein